MFCFRSAIHAGTYFIFSKLYNERVSLEDSTNAQWLVYQNLRFDSQKKTMGRFTTLFDIAPYKTL